jgi:hypothetical protein
MWSAAGMALLDAGQPEMQLVQPITFRSITACLPNQFTTTSEQGVH